MLERVTSTTGGQATLLRDAALNLCVAGECYLVQIPERIGSGEPETWDIKSVDEVIVSPDGKVRLKQRHDARAAGPDRAAAHRVRRPDLARSPALEPAGRLLDDRRAAAL